MELGILYTRSRDSQGTLESYWQIWRVKEFYCESICYALVVSYIPILVSSEQMGYCSPRD
jgi:hypothetical protein